MQEEIENTAQDLPNWEDKQRKESQQLREKFIKAAVKNPIDELRHKHKGHKGAVDFLKNIQKHIVDNLDDFCRHRNSPLPEKTAIRCLLC